MSQKGRGDEAQGKQEENHRQRRPVLERRNAKEMQDGHVDKVMAEEENRNGDEKK
jgi:hypothetical protein